MGYRDAPPTCPCHLVFPSETTKKNRWRIKNLLSGPAIGQPLSPSEWRRLVPDQLSSKGDLGGEETGGSAVLNMYLRAMLETRP